MELRATGRRDRCLQPGTSCSGLSDYRRRVGPRDHAAHKERPTRMTMMIGVSYNEFDVSTYEAVYLYYGAERQCEQFASGDPAQDFKAALAFAERVATTPGEGPLRFHRDRPDL